MKHLFLFTIGPVQSFIVQARKTQDLYAGSKLLSDLISFAIEKVKDEYGAEIKFPAEDLESKPNRFLAQIETEDIENVGHSIEDAVRHKFSEKANTIFNNRSENQVKPSNFDDQIGNFLDIHWVFLEFDEKDHIEKYEEIYEEIEKMLGAIKNVREFKQLNNGEGEVGRKCSLCGERNVLFCAKKTVKRGNKDISIKESLQIKPNWNSLSEEDKKIVKSYNNSIVEVKSPFALSEGLCAPCFTKRFYEKEEFASTAEIAMMHQIRKDDLKNFKLDPQLFYDENLTDNYFKKYNISHNLDSVIKKRNEILRNNGLKHDELSKYYALVRLDGDDMGRWLSGEFLGDEIQFLEDFHKNLACKLGSFAKSVGDIIKDPKGQSVYAGGDDVLAFVNLNHIVSVMRELRTGFPKFEDISHVHNQTSSASCGVCIAHYKTPLSEALNWARRMEKEAKSIDGKKDAFAIVVLKRSGEIRKTGFKWKYNDIDTTETLEELIQSLKKEEFSNTFIKNLGMEFSLVMDEEGKYEDNRHIITEMGRLIDRSYMLKRRQDETKEEFLQRKRQSINNLTKRLQQLYTNSKSSLDNFLSFMDIADFIERGGE